jgi:hypothetical protein
MTGPRLLQLFSAMSLGCAALLVASVAAGAPVLPDFDSATFDPNQPIDNPYFPMTGSSTLRYTGSEDGEPIDTYFEHTNQGLGPVLLGVQTFVQRDREFEDGLLVEDTFDYFAQDTDGNVWWFGREGEWRAGEDGAEAGIAMLDKPRVGDGYAEMGSDGEAGQRSVIKELVDELVIETTTTEGQVVVRHYERGTGLVLSEVGETELELVAYDEPQS